MPLFGIHPSGLLQTVFEDIGTAVAVIDKDRNVVFANKTALALFNTNEQQFPTHFDSWRKEFRFENHLGQEIPLDQSVVLRAMASERPESQEIRLKLMDGTTKFLLAAAYPFSTMGFAGVLVLGLDQTAEVELRHATSQLQRMEVLGVLSATLAHDFNNLLGIILTNVAMANRDQCSSADIHARLKQIEEATRSAAEVVKRLMEFGRTRQLHVQNVQINDVVNSILHLLHPLFRGNVRLVTELANDLPTVEADASQIEQVLTNLVLNALDAMPDGGEMEISSSVAEPNPNVLDGIQSKRRVVVSVADTGVGIPEERQADIFEPFFTTKLGKGTGLGLSSSYGIMRQHNGSIEVESTPGKGAKFSISLPVKATVVTMMHDSEKIAQPG